MQYGYIMYYMHVYNNKLCNHNNLKTLYVKVGKLISVRINILNPNLKV